MSDLDDILRELNDHASRTAFADLPDRPNTYYAVWLDEAGALEVSRVSPVPVQAGIVYVGECVTQSVRRHLAHNQIGSLTLMKNLAALFRERWRLEAERKGTKLCEPGLTQLRDWMDDHLTATVTNRRASVTTKAVLSALDPYLRVAGWGPERTPLRQHLTAQRAELDRRP